MFINQQTCTYHYKPKTNKLINKFSVILLSSIPVFLSQNKAGIVAHKAHQAQAATPLLIPNKLNWLESSDPNSGAWRFTVMLAGMLQMAYQLLTLLHALTIQHNERSFYTTSRVPVSYKQKKLTELKEVFQF